VKKGKTALLYLMAIVIGLIPALVALVQEANTYTLAKYYLYMIIIVVILWLVIQRVTRKKNAI
jgi:uncharacterized membrane protein YhaH (DUF805 family)